MRQLTFVAKRRLEWQNVPEPRLQAPGEALVRPLAVARCDVDRPMLLGLTPFQPPFAFGHEFVAEVVSTGDDVLQFKPGDRVLVSFQITCGQCARCSRGLTGSCLTVPPGAAYGFGGRGDWGGALADLVRVPYADSMLLKLPSKIEPQPVASCDNLPDGWRTVGPYLKGKPDTPVLVMGGGARSVGLYAAAIAVALGSTQVDYVDTDPERLELAARVGANPVEGPATARLGPYPVTVDASASVGGLACALRSCEPGGVCTSVGIYFSPETPLPLFDMYNTGVTFHTGRVNARTHIPDVIDLVESDRLRPELLTTVAADWEEAPDALLDPSVKVVLVRS